MDLFKALQQLSELEEMATIGRTTDNYEIIVFTNDPGKIPHFHYRDASTRGSVFHTCIRLDKPDYFLHEGKTDKLNAKQKKELIKFLNANANKGKYFSGTNWNYLVAMWNNENNSDVYIDEDTIMPDYKQL